MKGGGGVLCAHSGQREEDTPLTRQRAPGSVNTRGKVAAVRPAFSFPGELLPEALPSLFFWHTYYVPRALCMSLNLCNLRAARCRFPLSYRIRNRGSERVSNLPTVTQPETGQTGATHCSPWGLQQHPTHLHFPQGRTRGWGTESAPQPTTLPPDSGERAVLGP